MMGSTRYNECVLNDVFSFTGFSDHVCKRLRPDTLKVPLTQNAIKLSFFGVKSCIVQNYKACKGFWVCYWPYCIRWFVGDWRPRF